MQTGLSPPSRSMTAASVSCSPPATSSTDLEGRRQPHLRADRHRRRGSGPCSGRSSRPSTVSVTTQDLRRQRRQQRQRQVAVRDRAAEGALGLRALDVDVDPLVVAGRVGELVDVLLGDLVPVAGAELACRRVRGARPWSSWWSCGDPPRRRAVPSTGSPAHSLRALLSRGSRARASARPAAAARPRRSGFTGRVLSLDRRLGDLRPGPPALGPRGCGRPAPAPGRRPRAARCCCSTGRGGRTTAAPGARRAARCTTGSRPTRARCARSARSSGSLPDDVVLGARSVDDHGGWSYTTVLARPGPADRGRRPAAGRRERRRGLAAARRARPRSTCTPVWRPRSARLRPLLDTPPSSRACRA